jgi:hypothetical protein
LGWKTSGSLSLSSSTVHRVVLCLSLSRALLLWCEANTLRYDSQPFFPPSEREVCLPSPWRARLAAASSAISGEHEAAEP